MVNNFSHTNFNIEEQKKSSHLLCKMQHEPQKRIIQSSRKPWNCWWIILSLCKVMFYEGWFGYCVTVFRKKKVQTFEKIVYAVPFFFSSFMISLLHLPYSDENKKHFFNFQSFLLSHSCCSKPFRTHQAC